MTRDEALALSDGLAELRMPHTVEVGFHEHPNANPGVPGHRRVVVHAFTLHAGDMQRIAEVGGRHGFEFGFFGGEFKFRPSSDAARRAVA